MSKKYLVLVLLSLLILCPFASAQVSFTYWRLIVEGDKAFMFSTYDYEEPVGLQRSYACQKGSPKVEAHVYYRGVGPEEQIEDIPSMGARTKGCDALCGRLYALSYREELKDHMAPAKPKSFRTRQLTSKGAAQEMRRELSEVGQFGDADNKEIKEGLAHNRGMLSIFRKTCELN